MSMTAEIDDVRTVDTFTKRKIRVPELLTILDDEKIDRAPDQMMFRIISAKDGDKRVVWNRFSLPEINAAKQMFLSLLAEGMVPYRVGSNGGASSVVMDEFDPSAEEVIFLPTQAIRGG